LGHHNRVQSQDLEVSIAARANLGRCEMYDSSLARSPLASVGIPWPANIRIVVNIPGESVSISSSAYVVFVPRRLLSILHLNTQKPVLIGKLCCGSGRVQVVEAKEWRDKYRAAGVNTRRTEVEGFTTPKDVCEACPAE